MRNLEAIKTAKIGNEELRILIDEEPQSPRECDNLGTMVCFHDRYNLGDFIAKNPNVKGKFDSNENFTTPENFNEFLEENKGKIVLLNLFLYDHSGISMRAFDSRPNDGDYPFNDRWDAGQVGYIYVTYKRLMEEYGVKRVGKKTIETALRVLHGEVKVYSQYLEGDVYGFQIVKKKKCESCDNESEETIDSCWGFFGSDLKENGILDQIPKKWAKKISN